MTPTKGSGPRPAEPSLAVWPLFRGASPDPLTTLADTNKALRHRLLSVPSLRTRYLVYMGEIAGKWLDWKRLGPLVQRYRALIDEDIMVDTRMHDTYHAFLVRIYGTFDGSPPLATSIKGFAELRRTAHLAHPEIVNAKRR